MAEIKEKDPLRERLIRAGIEEIAAHGITDFSLRRVAAACQVSCAAPYRHFKNREEFIRATVAYINSQWELLRDNITRLFEKDPTRQFTELCIAYIRFLLANDNYRTVLAASPRPPDAGGPFSALPHTGKVLSPAEERRRLFSVHALLYGTVSMLESGEVPNEDETFHMIRKTLTDLIGAEGEET